MESARNKDQLCENPILFLLSWTSKQFAKLTSCLSSQEFFLVFEMLFFIKIFSLCCVKMSKYFKTFSVLISNTVKMNRYNLYRYKFLVLQDLIILFYFH